MRIGDILNGSYQIERPLGVGGQARVWQARHLRLPRAFAVKECPLGGTDPRERAERRALFERERDILAALSHPGHTAIPKVSDFWEEPDQLFLVMDLVDGETLIELLSRRGRFTEEEVIGWGIQLCGVLTYLHGWNPPIIYRDLSPDNVMLDRSGQLHLIDFGIARTFKEGQAQNTTSLGKAGYASPEHLAGGKAQTDGRSDIYTLGALLYHLLTGQEPVAVVERLKQRANLQGGRFLLRPTTLNHKISPALEAWVLKAMELDADRRFQSAGEAQRALEVCALQVQQSNQRWPGDYSPQRLKTRPVDPSTLWTGANTPPTPSSSLPTYPQTPPSRTSEPQPRNPLQPQGPTSGPNINRGTPPQGSGNLGPSPLRRGATGPAGAAPIPPSGPLPAQPSGPLMPAEAAEPFEWNPSQPGGAARHTGALGATSPRSPSLPGQRQQEPGRRGDTGALLPMPAGRKPLPPSPVPQRGSLLSRRQVLIGLGVVGIVVAGGGVAGYVLSRPHPLYTPLYTLSGDNLPVQCVAWSPDSRRLASGGNNEMIKIWDARAGTLSLRLQGHTDFVQSVAWSPDGFSLASASADEKIFIWDALQGGSPQYTLTGHTDTVYSVAWSPNGRQIASASADKTVRVWDVQSSSNQAKLVLTGHTDTVYSVAWSPDGALLVSASNDGTAKTWNPIQGGPALHSFSNNKGFLRSAVWSPDSKRVATASHDKVVTIWDADTSYPPAFTLSGANDILTSVSWSQDGALLAAGSADHSITIWHAQQGSPVLTTLSGHRGLVNSVAWSPDLTMLASASFDGTVIIWQSAQ
jgi:serine/threonine protein kinase/Tol biopolymer transport system component